MPADFPNPERWPAFVALHDPAERYEDAAALVNRSTGTISAWMQKWRRAYGPDFLRMERRTAAQRGQEGGRRRQLARWVDARAEAAAEAGHLSRSIFELAQIWVDRQLQAIRLGQPSALDDLDMKDYLMMVRVGELAGSRADALAGVPHPDRAGRALPSGFDGEGSGLPPEGLFDAFDEPHEGIRAVLEDVASIHRVYVERGFAPQGTEPMKFGDVVDVDTVEDEDG